MRPSTSADLLRSAALDALLLQQDTRAVDVLRRAIAVVEPAVREWDGSSGHMVAHRVVLCVEASDLALLTANPASYDALCAAFATATSHMPGELLAELVVRFTLETPAGVAHAGPYRGTPPRVVDPRDPGVLKRALEAYLAGLGESALALSVAAGRVACTRGRRRTRVVVTIPIRDDRRGSRADDAVIAAVHALLRGPDTERVEVIVAWE